MRAIALLAVTLLAPATLALYPSEGADDRGSSSTIRLVAFGDTGVNARAQANVNGSIAEGAEGFLGLGDYAYDAPVSSWRAMFEPLTRRGAHLAIGNHDDAAALGIPNATWSVALGATRIVAIDTGRSMSVGSWQHDFARDALCDAPEGMRVLMMHAPWWLTEGARHPWTEFRGDPSAMDALVEDCGVDLVLAAHEHNYQRLVRSGVAYVIVGTGGQSEYPATGVGVGTIATAVGTGRLVLDINGTGYSAHWSRLDGTIGDAFSWRAPSTPPPGAPRGVEWSPRTGNEWWAQVRLGGPSAAGVTRVESRDTDGPWVAMPKRSWGDYAATYHIEPGHLVWYRATLADGSVVESCAYAHTARTCANAPPGTFAAEFLNVRGDEWWLESDVNVSGGTLANVDARVNGGPWAVMELEPWGAWARSLHAPNGSRVELRATSTEGAVVAAAYTWPPR